MESSVVKLILLIGAGLLLAPIAYVLNRPTPWMKPLSLFIVAISAVALHYLLVQTSITATNTLSLGNGVLLVACAATAAAAFSPIACLVALRRFALLLAFPVTLYLLALHFTGNGYDDVGSFIGFTENSNVMGAYLALFLFPPVVHGLINPAGRPAKIAIAVLGIAIIFLVFKSASRASLLAILAGLAFIALFSNSFSWRYRAAIVVGLALSPIFLSSFIQKYDDLELFSSRAMLYQLRFEAISARPWTGWGLASDVNNTFNQTNVFPPQEKGNTILQMVEEFGAMLGGAAVVIITAAIVGIGRRLAKIKSLIWVPYFLAAAWVHSQFETWMFNFQSTIAMYFWLTLMFAAFQSRVVARAPVLRGSIARQGVLDDRAQPLRSPAIGSPA